MRLIRRLLPGVLGCLTLFFLLNSRSSTNSVEPLENRNLRKNGETDRYLGDVQTYRRRVTASLAELAAQGKFPERNGHVLMLTRVPGAGAELLVLILQHLQGYNAFKHIRLPPGDHGLLTTLQQELLVEEITGIVRQEAIPLTFDGDVSFLNFSKFGRQAPTFLSLVRNPRNFLSRTTPPRSHRSKYNDLRAVKLLEPLTTSIYRRAIPYFCGQDVRCQSRLNNGDRWPLERAKENVLRWYPVVGILEYMENTLTAFENAFPYFFKGAIRFYRKLRSKEKYSYVSPSPVTSILDSNVLASEIEFYEWLKSRLFNGTAN